MSAIPHPRRRPPPGLALLGGGVCAAALVLAATEPGALAGWLAAFAFWSGVPIGALCILMMMRLIPGAWTEQLSGPAEAVLLLLPLAALAVLPVLIGCSALYRWAGGAGEGGFRSLYLTPWFFITRTIIFFAASAVLAVLLLRRRSRAVAAVGLIIFVLVDTTVAVDWLMSLDPEFHSSGFGLYVLSIQATVALSVLVLARLVFGPGGRTGILGGLLLTALLLWAYFAFMQYVVSWSDNLPPSVLWYGRRGRGAWSAVEGAIGALGVAPALLLLFPPIRRGRGWLLGICLAVLLGKALETAWLVLPEAPEPGAAAMVAGLAVIGLGALAAGLLPAAIRSAGRWRTGPARQRAASP